MTGRISPVVSHAASLPISPVCVRSTAVRISRAILFVSLPDARSLYLILLLVPFAGAAAAHLAGRRCRPSGWVRIHRGIFVLDRRQLRLERGTKASSIKRERYSTDGPSSLYDTLVSVFLSAFVRAPEAAGCTYTYTYIGCRPALEREG